MTLKTARLVLALRVLFLGVPAVSTAAAPHIASIEVSGTTRTTRDAVLTLARVHEGDPWREEMAEEVLHDLRNARLFYDEAVDVRRDGDAVTLRIRLKDKWTLIPVPLVVVKSGESTYGLTLLESNFFGLAKTLFTTLAVQDGRPGGSLLFMDPHVLSGDFQLFGFFVHRDGIQQVWDEDEKIGTYREKTTGGSIGVGYRVSPHTSLSVGFRAQNFSEHDAEDSAIPPRDGLERAVSVRLQYDGADVDEETRRGLSGHVSLGWGLPGLGDELGRRTLSGEAKLALNPLWRHTLLFALHGLCTNERDYAVDPATKFLRGYEQGRFRPDRLLGGSADYQIPVARFREVTLSGVAFVDAALLRDSFRAMTPGDVQADAGLALAAYVRRVAVPMLQLYVAHGFSTGRVLPGFSLGMAF